jgi:DNA mismatch endonuclease (patch repair protein)
MHVHDSATRSYNMSSIRPKDTKPEIIIRKFLHSNGFRYRLHDKNLPGKPDIVLAKYKTIIDIRGCFWHGHEGCRLPVKPKIRSIWWEKKISETIERYRKKTKLLIELDWRIIVIGSVLLKRKIH